MWIRFKNVLVGGLLVGALLSGKTVVALSASITELPRGIEPQPSLAAAGCEESDLIKDRAVVRAKLEAQLMELVEDCSKKKLFATRTALYELVLEFDPENVEAKKGLGYKKQKDGSWTLKPRRMAPKDKSASLAEEIEAQKKEALTVYAEHLLAVLKSYESVASKENRELLMSDVLAVDPNNAVVREARGETLLEEDWVLKETAIAKQRRAELKDFVRAAFASLPPLAAVEPTPREAAFGLPWSVVISTPVGRTLGTASKAEIEKLSQAMWVTRSYFNDTLGARGTLPKELTVYSFGAPADGLVFVDKHPDVDEDYRAFLKTLEGSGIQGTGDFAQWAPNEQRRLDGLVRQAVAWLFAGAYEIFPKHGWVFEGFGLYLTREIAGTRLTWFVGPSSTLDAQSEQELRDRLMEPTTNWMNEAFLILQAPGRPNLKKLLEKGVNELTPEDLLYSYVLAAYLIEAEAPHVPELLRTIGKGKSSVLAIQAELKTQIPELEDRILRWLSERLAR